MTGFSKDLTRALSRVAMASLVSLSLFAVGCSDDNPTTEPADEFAPPTNLTYVNDSNSVLLAWTATPDASIDEFAGYHVYRDIVSMANLTDAQLVAKKITATPIQTTSRSDGSAVNGTKYFYAVRAVKDNGDISESTNEINTAPRAGETGIVVAERTVPSLPSGLGLSEGQAFALQSEGVPDNRPFIDVYLGTNAANDAGSGQLTLKSPHLVDGASNTWSRVAGLKILDSFDAPTTTDSGWQEEVSLGVGNAVVGKVIAIKTPIEGSNYHYAKVRVTGFNGAAGGERTITVETAYQSIPDFIRFTRR